MQTFICRQLMMQRRAADGKVTTLRWQRIMCEQMLAMLLLFSFMKAVASAFRSAISRLMQHDRSLCAEGPAA